MRHSIEKNQKNKTSFIPGLHSVREALASDRIKLHEIWISEGRDSIRLKEILDMAQRKNVPVFFKKAEILDDALPSTSHQGIIALSGEFTYLELEDIIDLSMNRQGYGLLIAADHITDEGNLGAIIRTAAFFGAHGLIIPKDRSAQVTYNVVKRSSGAYITLPVARVVNISRALDILTEKGFWIIGTSGEASQSVYGFDWCRHVVLVMGSEDKGLGHIVRNKAHEIVSIPVTGAVPSLNVSVACGVILSEIVRQRTGKI
jgi:23S rRNA (guanosine2251-2'-O)-methyltransferase